jgi:hypothetical protein
MSLHFATKRDARAGTACSLPLRHNGSTMRSRIASGTPSAAGARPPAFRAPAARQIDGQIEPVVEGNITRDFRRNLLIIGLQNVQILHDRTSRRAASSHSAWVFAARLAPIQV